MNWNEREGFCDYDYILYMYHHNIIYIINNNNNHHYYFAYSDYNDGA